MSRDGIVTEIVAERERQDALFGGPAHDDRHAPSDWLRIIVCHVGLAGWDGSPEDVCLREDVSRHYDPARYRRQLVRAAAVAVAALETFDRLAPPPAPSVDPLDGLRLLCQGLADRWGEPVLLVPDLPSPLHREPRLPYAVLAGQADAREVKAAAERFLPQAKEAR